MRFILDENIPHLKSLLEDKGYECVLSTDMAGYSAPDDIVALTAQEEGYILISADRDFNVLAPRVTRGENNRFRKLSRVHLKCKPTQLENRLAQCLDLIEFEYHAAQIRHDSRMIIQIDDSYVRVDR